MPHQPEQLARDLNFRSALAMVVGSVIGVNVFIRPASMAQALPSGPGLLAVWIAAGLASLGGALLYAELGTMFPKAGGEYVYLREAFGEMMAFLFVWMVVIIRATLNVAMYSLAIGGFAAALIPSGGPWLATTVSFPGAAFPIEFGFRQVFGVALVAALAAVNCLGVRSGGAAQTVLTAIKVAGVALLITGGLLAPAAAVGPPPHAPNFSVEPILTCMLAALGAYNGWAFIGHAAGEVAEPQRNLPRALILGVVVVIFLYSLLNFTYIRLLGVEEMAASNSSRFPDALSVGAKAAEDVLGPAGLRALSVLFLFSALGSANGFLLSTSRVPFALARDGLFFERFGRLNRNHVPQFALLSGVAAGSLLTLGASYDRITETLMFSTWIFYVLTAAAVIVLRRRAPHHPRPYRSPGYPILPLGIIGFGITLIAATLRARPFQSSIVLLLIVVGVPVYFLFSWARRTPAAAASEI